MCLLQFRVSQFLQGAQKVLENLTQQQNQLAPTSQQPQTFTPSVTPGGAQQQQPPSSQAQPEAAPESDGDFHHQHQESHHQPEEGRDTTS